MLRADKLGLVESIGADRFFDSKGHAIRTIFPSFDQSICQGCGNHAFIECDKFDETSDKTLDGNDDKSVIATA